MQQQTSDPGVGNRFTGEVKRIINSNGSFNVVKTGRRWSLRDSFQYLVTLSWRNFLLLIVAVFVVVNLLFACLYVGIGVEYIVGANPNLSALENAFFFSVQTLTTIGYGHLVPKGALMNIAVCLEAIIGLLSFALATGLMYARFSRPTARIKFSKSMLVAPYKDGMSLQFRLANMRKNVLMDAEIRVLLTLTKQYGDEFKRQFYQLDLETERITFFPLSWTVVHPITAESPVYGFKREDFEAHESEILISFKAFDDAYSETIYDRYSYTFREMKWNKQFEPAFTFTPQGITKLDLNKIDVFKKVQVNE